MSLGKCKNVCRKKAAKFLQKSCPIQLNLIQNNKRKNNIKEVN